MPIRVEELLLSRLEDKVRGVGTILQSFPPNIIFLDFSTMSTHKYTHSDAFAHNTMAGMSEQVTVDKAYFDALLRRYVRLISAV